MPIDTINFRPSAERGNPPPPAFGSGSPRLASWPGYATRSTPVRQGVAVSGAAGTPSEVRAVTVTP